MGNLGYIASRLPFLEEILGEILEGFFFFFGGGGGGGGFPVKNVLYDASFIPGFGV